MSQKLEVEPRLQGENPTVVEWARRVTAAVNPTIDDVTSLKGSIAAYEGAWVAMTGLTVVPSAGSLGGGQTVVGRYKQIGKSFLFQLLVSIPNNGSAGGYLYVAGLPWVALNFFACSGVDAAINGWSIVGTLIQGSNALSIRKYDGTYPASSGSVIAINGICEAT